ncbi:diacylglycerol acyltransferase-domain-containing protein [Aspergillus spectabilis]
MGEDQIQDLVGYDHKLNRLFTVPHPSSQSQQKVTSISRPYLRNPKSHTIRSPKDVFQLLAVLYHVITIYPLLPALLLSIYAIYNPLYILLAALLSLILPRTFTHRSRVLRSLPMWRLFASYFPIHLYRSTPLPLAGKYIFGYHPHGILSHGAFTAFATEALGFSELFPGIENSLLTLDSSFRIPIYRDYLLLLGMNSVSRKSCENLLTTSGHDTKEYGRAITIVIGGAKESLEAIPNNMRLVLRNRKGFVKLAIQTGASLVPVVAFGENDLYTMETDLDPKTLSGRVQLFLKQKLGFTVPLFYAKGPHWFDFGIMPYARPVNVVVGRPIETRIVEGIVDGAYLNEIHGRYIEEVERIWREWRGVFASGCGEMEIL